MGSLSILAVSSGVPTQFETIAELVSVPIHEWLGEGAVGPTGEVHSY